MFSPTECNYACGVQKRGETQKLFHLSLFFLNNLLEFSESWGECADVFWVWRYWFTRLGVSVVLSGLSAENCGSWSRCLWSVFTGGLSLAPIPKPMLTVERYLQFQPYLLCSTSENWSKLPADRGHHCYATCVNFHTCQCPSLATSPKGRSWPLVCPQSCCMPQYPVMLHLSDACLVLAAPISNSLYQAESFPEP